MSQAIRSEADKQLIELCSAVILNMARYEHTKIHAFQVSKYLFNYNIFTSIMIM